MANNQQQETYECDVLVVGSGCAGLSAAVTAGHRGLNVLVVEKEPRFGGTTARSGGWLWIPGTSLARAWGISESPDQARTYLRHEAGNTFDAARVDAFLTNGPEAVEFFTSKTALRFDMPLTFPDYHAEAPGGAQGGRSMVTRPFDGHELGEHIKDLGAPLPELTVFGMMLGSGKEIIHFMRATKSLDIGVLCRQAPVETRHRRAAQRPRHDPDQWQRAGGTSRKIGVRPQDTAVAVVAGARIDRRGRCRAWRGRSSATAEAFALRQSAASCSPAAAFRTMWRGVKKMFPHAPTGNEHFSPGPIGNTGDGLRLAEAAGGRVEDSLPNAAAWVPVSITTRKDGSQGVMPHFIDRAKPGVIAVTRGGARFANEGNSYHDFVQEMVKASKPGEEITAFLVTDHRSLRKYGLGCVPPFPMPLGHHLRTGYLMRGATLGRTRHQGRDRSEAVRGDGRSNSIRPPPEGRDPDFGKGSRAYNRYQGDALHGPNPCIAPIQHGPFYAIKMVIGDLGTYAGIKTDENARALDADGHPIVGLYAAGNDMASIMGGNYPGAGITLGPALTFGYIAGKHIAGMTA